MRITFLNISTLFLLFSFNVASASTISIGGTPGTGGIGSTTPTVTTNEFNIFVDGNLYIDYSVFSSNQEANLSGDISLIADTVSIFSFDQIPTHPDSTVVLFNELNLSLNTSGEVLLFSDTPVSSGIFEATNIYVGNYNSFNPVPVPPAIYLFLSGLIALFGKNALTRTSTPTN